MSSKRWAIPFSLLLTAALLLPAGALLAVSRSAPAAAVLASGPAPLSVQTALTPVPALLADHAAAVPQVARRGWDWRAGGDLRDVWFTDADNGWVVGNVGLEGLLHTTDGGRSWTAQDGPAGGYSLNDLEFVDGQQGWAVGAGGAILHTSDGATWRPQDSGTGRSLTALSFADAWHGWAGDDVGYLHRTTDGGATWAGLGRVAPGAIEALEFLDATTGWLGAVGPDGYHTDLYKTTDGGASWQESGLLMEGSTRDLFFLDAQHGWFLVSIASGPWWGVPSAGVYRTTDGGSSWQYLAGGGTAPSRIQFVTPDLGWIAGSEIYITTDGGVTWTGQATGGYSGLHFVSHTRGWGVGSNGRISATADGGATWVQQAGTTIPTLEAVQFIGERTGYAVGEGSGIYGIKYYATPAYFLATTDAGATWAVSETTAPFAQPWGNDCRSSLHALDFLDASRGWLAGNYSFCDWYCTRVGYVLVTDDGGASWTAYDTGAVYQAMDRLDAETGVVVGQPMKRSTDGGATWATTFEPETAPRGVAFGSTPRGWAVGDGGKIWVSDDAGATWAGQTSPTTASLADVSTIDATAAWAVGDDGVIVGTTDGSTWVAQASGTRANLRAVQFVDRSRGWVAGDGGTILYTPDGGVTWQREETFTAASLKDVFMRSVTDGWAVGDSGIVLHYGGPPAERTIEARQAGAGPTLDGGLAEWAALRPVVLTADNYGSITGELSGPADLGASLRVAWAPDRLYFAASISDDVLVGNNSPNPWNDDVIELGIHVPFNGQTHQFSVAVDGRQTDLGNPITSLTVATRTVAGGWAVEVGVPAAALGLAQLAAGAYPFTFGLWDDDLFTRPGQTHLIWQGTSTYTYQPEWGMLDLSSTSHDFPQAATPTPTATVTATPGPAPTATATPVPIPGVWTSRGPEGGHILALAIDPVTPATLYMGTENGGVFKSTDGGGSWRAANTGLASRYVYALAIDPAAPTTLYAATENGVHKSTDGGGSWRCGQHGPARLGGVRPGD